MHRIVATGLCCAALAANAASTAQDLPRRADLGAAILPPEGAHGARIVRFRAGSVLEKAGLRPGDEIVAFDGRAFDAPGDYAGRVRLLKAGATVHVRWRSGVALHDADVVMPAMPHEVRPGLEVSYRAATTDRGWRVRTYVTRPAGVTARLPLVVFIPWLSCDAVEAPFPARNGWVRMLGEVMATSGAQVVRIEKPGVGDSEGPACADADLEDDLAAFRAGIRDALRDPGVDPARFVLVGGSVGGALAPVLARDFKPSAVVALGGFARTWYEHMLRIERQRLTLSGSAPGEVNGAMKVFTGFYGAVLLKGLTPAQAIETRPEWKAYWYDEPARQYGRPIRYYQQLQALDVESAWDAVHVPVLVMQGTFDWIMGPPEARRVGGILAGRPDVTVVLRERMNHHFERFADREHAFREEGGEYDDEAARLIARWIGSRTR
ncbi:MAG TPA: alpha/beta fold hydrolase [Usitatibacter sp.]|jgi:pimeloyl-ACP methyl ester carboxylesterase|nr:alpha/beta fold hydrolase [Usitatibacter sp.]